MSKNVKICILLFGLLTSNLSLHSYPTYPIMDASKLLSINSLILSDEEFVKFAKVVALAYVLMGSAYMGGLLLFKYLMDRHLEAITQGITTPSSNSLNQNKCRMSTE